MIDIYSKDKIQIPMPWQPLFPEEMVQEAMKKSTQAKLNPSASYFSYHRTHTAIYKETPRIRYQVAVPIEPETIGERWRTNLFRCDCERGRKHLPCLHEAALLWQVEKNSSTGVFTAEESPHDYVHRINLLSSRERLIREEEKQKAFDPKLFPALDFFKQRKERSGPLLYDIRSALSAYQTDAYSCAMAREILKAEQSYVFSAHEKQEKDGSRSLSVNLNLIDPVENCRFTAASAILSADHLTLTARAGFRNASGSTLQSVEDELHALALSYEGATKDEGHPLHDERSFPELEDPFSRLLSTVPSSSSSEVASARETFLNINGLVLCHLLWDYLDDHDEMVDFTDRNADLFFKELDKASQIETQKTVLPEEVRPKTVLLTPRIIIEEGEAKLSFKIAEGAARAYIIRNLQNLADAYRRKQPLALSKTSSIDFSCNDFTEESALLYDFIGRRVGEVIDANERIERKNYYSYVRTLSVTSSMDLKGALLDNFYDAWEGKNCEYSDKTNQIKDSSIPVGHRAFQLSLETERVQDAKGVFAGVRVKGLIPVLLSGSGSHRYILNADGLSRVTEEELSAMAPFHSVADASGSFRFQVGLAHLQEFYYRVVPSFLQNPGVDFHDSCAKEAEGHLPPEPVFDFYLDCLDLNEVKDKHLQKIEQQERMKRKNAAQKQDLCVLLRADVRYENARYSLCKASSQQEGAPQASHTGEAQADAATTDVYRDTIQEDRVQTAIQRYFPTWMPEKQSFATFFTDEEMFSFLQGGLSLLENYGTVHGTDAFRRHHIRKVMPVKVGVSVDSNIVNLELTSGELSPDELLEVMESYQKKKHFYKLSSGDYLDLTDADSLSQADLLMNALDLSPESVIAHGAKVPLYRALYLDKLLEEHEALASSRDRIYRSLIRNFHTIGEAEAEPPKTLENTLRPYQSYGFKWIKTLEGAGFGGILADEMGLGKTLQMISVLSSSYLDIASSAATPAVTAALSDPATLTTPAAPITGGASAFQNTKKGERADLLFPPSLIVCPASLVYNWQEEFHKFAADLSVTPITGGASAFQKLEAHWADRQIYIISYDLLKRNLARLNDKTFFYVILDEAQYIKNAGAAAAKSVKTLKAAHRFALTGTPIENRLSEMWSIFDFLMPGFLYGRKEFEKKWEVPITKSHDADASTQLRKMTSPFILRRKKEEVLKDLPAKLEEVRYVQIEGEQQKLYDAQVLRLKNALGEWEIPGQKMRVFAELTRIRQICCDPSLLNEGAVPIFLISLKAGGTGLNLTGADVVIHYDPWWNVAAQNQATDRAHRIGQTRQVTVYRLIIKDTIEERILELQNTKRDLAESILEGDSTSLSSLSHEELLELIGG